MRVQEEEAQLSGIEETMARCAAAIAAGQVMPTAEELDVIASGTDHTAEVYRGRKADRPWWDKWERRMWQREVEDAGTAPALAYLLQSLRNVCRRLLNAS